MHLPRYWAKAGKIVRAPKGKVYALTIWGWSDQDLAGARQTALRRLAQTIEAIESGGRPDRYPYGQEAPLREPVIASVPGADALISRNAYGALVLNTAGVFFADLDFPERRARLLAGLLGKKPVDPVEKALAGLRQWHTRRPDWALRVYRTRAGLRLLATHDRFDPAAGATRELLASLGSDPLYVTLCRSQACFRARLTPKPWRIGLQPPGERYPYETPAQEANFQAWLARYEAVAPRYAVCRLVAELGPRSQTAEAAQVLAVHDRFTCPPGDLPLA